MTLALWLCLQDPATLLLETTQAVERGNALFRQERWTEALAAYRSLPAAADLADVPRTRRTLQEIRTLQGEAQWLTAHGLARLERWEEARLAFQEARTLRPRPSFCGNAIAQFAVETLRGKGLCLERMGRHAEAVDVYLQVLPRVPLYRDGKILMRIVDLHGVAGALDRLERKLDVLDLAFRDPLKTQEGDPERLERLMKFAPGAPLRPLLAAARARNGAPRPVDPEEEPPALPFPPMPKDLKLP